MKSALASRKPSGYAGRAELPDCPASPAGASGMLTDAKRRKDLGQFLTPPPVADFMASLFSGRWREVNLLDAGAGAGALSSALVNRLCSGCDRPKKIAVTAYELDEGLIGHLQKTYDHCARQCAPLGIEFSAKILNKDFIEAAVAMVRDELFATPQSVFNAVIANPPYRKIHADSATRLLLRSAGIETSNLYTGFLSLLVKLLDANGEMVAITPRSFCNGPYFKPFRQMFLDAMSLRRLHVFESRSAAFRKDDVLQENIIVHAVKSRSKPETVIVSASSGEQVGRVVERKCAFRELVSPNDSEQFIHLVMDDLQDATRQRMGQLRATLEDVGVEVSTGRVVDFRARDLLSAEPKAGTFPLVYPCHFNGGFVHWPKINGRKPNAIRQDALERDLLVPGGVYVLVKRFTSKEEKRRVVACIFDSSRVHAPWVGFENHLNYFHARGKGVSMVLAKGLTAFLNSTMVDVYFRQFNGHTQVNATDLRNMRYPTRTQLESLGKKIGAVFPPQSDLNALVESELF
jgi:adenine-specific DNA-methyltransferase